MKITDGWLRRTLVSGSAASVLSTVVLMERSRREKKAPFAGVNAVSHWVHGDIAYLADNPSWRHTLPAAVVHHFSSLVWAALYEALIGKGPSSRRDAAEEAGDASLRELAVGAAVVTAVAACTDLRLVPDRLSPGFEHRLSPTSVVLVYAAFACGLALGGFVNQIGVRRTARPAPTKGAR